MVLCGIWPARQSKEKPAIVLAAPELSHRLMSGPLALIRGSRELLLNQRGLGLHVTVFKYISGQRGRTKDDSFVSSVPESKEKLGAHKDKS